MNNEFARLHLLREGAKTDKELERERYTPLTEGPDAPLPSRGRDRHEPIP